MFQITDEFINQAGFSGLEGEARERFRQEIVKMVELKIINSIIFLVGDELAENFSKVVDGDKTEVNNILKSLENYTSEADYKAIYERGRVNNSSQEDIDREYAVLAWLGVHNINIVEVVQDAMNESMTDLKMIHAESLRAVQDNFDVIK